MKNLKHLFTALMLLCTTVATAHDFEVGGIYYNILSEEDKTIEVTYRGTSYYQYPNQYTGSVIIPESVIYNGVKYRITSIGSNAFFGCTGLTSIEIPNSVTSIGYEAFYHCTGLTSIVIPNSVTSIGLMAFQCCDGLTNVVIGNSVTSIEEQTFYDCTSLTSVVIGNSVTSIGSSAFSNCTGLTSIEIPNSVTSIGRSAFSYCTGLTSVEIPNSVTSIGRYAFDRTAWDNNQLDGVVYAGKVLYKYKGTMPWNTSISIKEGTLGIGDVAFYDCDYLTSVVIPNSVICIGEGAFWSCGSLTSVEIPNSVTSIGDEAFKLCGLTSVVIGNGVTSIGYDAFYYCDDLKSITSHIPADKLFVPGDDAFYNISYRCTLYVPSGAREAYAATDGWSKFKYSIVELEPTELTITINEYGCATYCSEYALDFSEVEGLKAYAATGYNVNTGVITLTRLQTAREGTGLFLKGEPGEYVVSILEETGDYSLNMLVGTLEATTVNSTEGEMSNYKFTIADGDAAPMFYPFEDNTTFSAGKAYLQIPTAWLPATAQKSLSIRFDDGETTDIDELKGESGKVKGICYDLSGRVVENPTSGIYIINGKKVVVK